MAECGSHWTRGGGSDVIVVGPMGVTMAQSYFAPDLIVASRAWVRGARELDTADALLVVEIVSPGSKTNDRITRPARYAGAGISAYWLIETNPATLTAYSLPAGASAYIQAGAWAAGEVAHLAEPFPVDIGIDIDRLAAPA
jgi:Uma2 family endonuclease